MYNTKCSIMKYQNLLNVNLKRKLQKMHMVYKKYKNIYDLFKKGVVVQSILISDEVHEYRYKYFFLLFFSKIRYVCDILICTIKLHLCYRYNYVCSYIVKPEHFLIDFVLGNKIHFTCRIYEMKSTLPCGSDNENVREIIKMFAYQRRTNLQN